MSRGEGRMGGELPVMFTSFLFLNASPLHKTTLVREGMSSSE